MNNNENKKSWKVQKEWLWALALLTITCFILLFLSDAQFPAILLSSGLVAIISAFIGVLVTVLVTSSLLNKQSENQEKTQVRLHDLQTKTQNEILQKQSDTDKDIRIYQNKIQVYSAFTKKMWALCNDLDGQAAEAEQPEERRKMKYKLVEDLKVLRNMCFQELVLYLGEDQMKMISEHVSKIDISNVSIHEAVAQITGILKANLKEDDHIPHGEFLKLYGAFDKSKFLDEDKEEETVQEVPETILSYISSQEQSTTDPQFWHMVMWDDKQIKAFEEGRWYLSVWDYGNDKQTRLLKQIKPGDVVFLLQRGGAGYIGAFRTKRYIIIDNTDIDPHKRKITFGDNPGVSRVAEEKDVEDYDIYNIIRGGAGADWVSSLEVEPIAYNYLGVGYYTVKRRTIERFVNNPTSVDYLLERFSGNELEEGKEKGKGYLSEKKRCDITKENENFFMDGLPKIKNIERHRKVKTLQREVERIAIIKGKVSLWDNAIWYDYKLIDDKGICRIWTRLLDNEWKVYLSHDQPEMVKEIFPELFQNGKNAGMQEACLKTFDLDPNDSNLQVIAKFFNTKREEVERDLTNRKYIS